MWGKVQNQLWQWRGVLVAGPGVAFLIIALRLLGGLQALELAALDRFFVIRTQPRDPRIVIVTIRESDIQQLQEWPLSDESLLTLLKMVKAQQPRAIGLDLYRDLVKDKNAPEYQALAAFFRETPNLIGVQKVSATKESEPVKPPPVLKELDQVGANDLPQDRPGFNVRRGLLYADTQEGELIFGFALRLADLYLQPESAEITQTPDELIKAGDQVLPVLSRFSGGYALPREEVLGYQVLLNYRGPIDRFETISLSKVMAGQMPPDLMQDKVVLIGTTAESLKDIFPTPYQRMAGVTIHANLVSEVISAALNNRPPLRTWPEPVEWIWIFGWSMLGATTAWTRRFQNSDSNTKDKKSQLVRPWAIAILGFAAGSLLVGSFVAFTQSWWIPVVPPMIGLLGSALAITGYIARSVSDMRQTLGRYLTDEVVASLLETPAGLKLGGETRKVTILMSDLRGFSAMSGQLPPETVVKILNDYLEVMTDVITRYNGTINEIMGDGIFVMFGAPVQREDDSCRAIACALGMALAMEQVNQNNRTRNLPALEMGVGINTGEVVAGNIGSQKRAKYTVVGNAVNLAARVESYTVGGQIFISEVTYRDACESWVKTAKAQGLDAKEPALDEFLKIKSTLKVQAKGIKEPITLYDVIGIGEPYNLELPQAEQNLIELQNPVWLRYAMLEGKHLVDTLFDGQFLRLADNSAELYTENPLSALANLKINLLDGPERREIPGDLYAKVISPVADHLNCYYIRFTAVPPQVDSMVGSLLSNALVPRSSEPAATN